MVIIARTVDEAYFSMSDFQGKLGYIFRNNELLQQALTHPSFYSNKKALMTNHFERLEFVGDRVLGLVVGDMLYKEFPTVAEGDLARKLAWLVCRDTLAKVAHQIGISEELKYSRASDNNPTQWVTFLSDACEALIGAVYFDGGFECVVSVIEKFWTPLLHQKAMSMKDPKTELQEYVQANYKELPQYKIVQQVGPAHNPEITVECKVKDMMATATASSRKIAEGESAQAMLQILRKI